MQQDKLKRMKADLALVHDNLQTLQFVQERFEVDAPPADPETLAVMCLVKDEIRRVAFQVASTSTVLLEAIEALDAAPRHSAKHIF